MWGFALSTSCADDIHHGRNVKQLLHLAFVYGLGWQLYININFLSEENIE